MRRLLQSPNASARFILLALGSLLLTLPYALPAFWDVLRQRMGGLPGEYIYLLKPVENQTWYLILAIVPAAILSLAWQIALPRPAFHGSRLLAAIVALWFLAKLASVPQALDPAFTLKALMMPFAFLLGFVLLCLVPLDTRQVQKVILVLIVGALPVSLYAVAQNQGYEFLPYSTTAEGTGGVIKGKQLIASTFGHPNYMASYLAPLLYLAMYLVLAWPRHFLRYLGGAAALAILAALVVGGTRGPWLGVVVAAVPYYILLTLSPQYRRPLLFAAGVAVLFALVLLVVPIPFLQVQFDVSQRLMGSKEITARFYYWLMAIEMFKDHPMLGVGYSNYDVLFWDYVDAFQKRPGSDYFNFVLEDSIRGVRPGFVHNDYLQLLAEGGLLGIAVWLALWSAVITQGINAARRLCDDHRCLLMAASLLAALVVVAVDGLTNFPIHIPVSGFLFFCLLGIWGGFYRRQVISPGS